MERILICMLIIVSPLSLPVLAEFEEGVHYAELTIPVRVQDTSKIEVTEYFSYGCPHCFEFEPLINAWKKNLEDDVAFNRTPAIWNSDYQLYGQLYYTLEAMGATDRAHGAVFDAIQNLKKRLNDPKDMAVFLARFGVDPNDFAKVFKSFGVRASLQQAEARGRAYRASGVPSVIVNGRYRIEGSMAGSNARMLEIVDYLIKKERASRSSS